MTKKRTIELSKRTVWVVLILAILAAGTVAPALAADTYDVTVNNKNNITITLTFVGLKIYQFDLAPGKSTIQLERGPYTHSYYGCGQLNFADYTVKLKDNKIVIEDCNKGGGGTPAPGANEGTFTIISRSNKTLQVTLLGQDTFVLDVRPGKTAHVIKKGVYQISYYDCGLLNVDSITIRKETTLRIKNCAEPDLPEIDVNARILDVNNRTYTTFPITLIGLENNKDYFFTLTPGKNKLYALPGLYAFSYYACSQLHYGTVRVNSRGGDLDIATCSSSLNGGATTNNLGTFKLKNNTRGTVVLQLNGYLDYLFAITGGGAFLTAEKGFYQYTLWACGTSFDGVIQVGPDGLILKTPYCSNTSQ